MGTERRSMRACIHKNGKKEEAVTIQDQVEDEIHDSGVPHSCWFCGVASQPWPLDLVGPLMPVPGTLISWDAGDELSARRHEGLARGKGCKVVRHLGREDPRYFYIFLSRLSLG
jgi:hypothetical protein